MASARWMWLIRASVLAAGLLGLAALAAAAAGPTPIETPSLAPLVAEGKLPPIGERLPAQPLVVHFADGMAPGMPGGSIRTLVGGVRDLRVMDWYGYARLVGFDRHYDIHPDILESIEVGDNNRTFTMHLRAGHRWSDGAPFTAEDFRYFWEDMERDKELSPFGPDSRLIVDGHPPTVEILDAETVRYSWPTPNPTFLALLASPTPPFLYSPAHYLRQFHAKYADREALAARVREGGLRNWVQLHTKLDKLGRNDNPDLPTLAPWVNKTAPPSDRYVFRRNPYFHRIDENGRQLPYIDGIALDVGEPKIIPVKALSGETDLQARYLGFDSMAVLHHAARSGAAEVRLWRNGKGSHLALYPNLTVADPVWRALLRDVRFRHALSLAIDRHEINQVVYYGLAVEGNNTALEASPLYDPHDRYAWARYRPLEAAELLSEIGLTGRDDDGFRLLPDGRPLTIVVESGVDSLEQTDVLELVKDSWAAIGVRLLTKTQQVDVLRRRVFAGETIMSIASGVDNGVPKPDMSPIEFVPANQMALQWSQWGNYVEMGGRAGQPIDMERPRQLLELYRRWVRADSEEDRGEIWRRILAINAEDTYSIGLVSEVPQPVLVSRRLRNVPETGLYNFDPGAFFGIYHMDGFWVENAADLASVGPP
jgi:peptide/nickel transport system substrate-binding protein